MKLKYTFESITVGDEIIAVPLGDGAVQVHGILKLNAEGQEILRQLRSETTEEQVVSYLVNKYENERTTLADYVHKVLDTLRNAGLLEE